MASETDSRPIDTRGLTLRQFAAQGVIVNSAFDLGLGAAGMLRGFALAALLTRADYGVWGVLAASLGVLAKLKLVGISDKYVQQAESDQELAFQRAFTFELLISLVTMAVVVVAVPLVALVYGHWELLAPGLVLSTMLLADALQSPMWIAYRRMQFVRQRLQAAVEPVLGLLVAVVLAVLGMGYWSLVIGVLAGAWGAALVAVLVSPYRLRLRYDRGALKLYARFSGPLWLATLATVVMVNGVTLATNFELGLAGVGAVALMSNITAFTTRVDDLVAATIYPAICAVQDRLELLRESFVKSNRLALLWAMPFGVGLALFAHDLIEYVLGAKWRPATTLLQLTGVIAAVNHIGFNWDDYFRARTQTRPVMLATVLSAAVTLGAGIPLLAADGLTGLAVGLGAGGVANLLLRGYYVRRLFAGFRFTAHALRAVLPTVPAALIVLLARGLDSGPDTAAFAALLLVIYLLAVVAGSIVLERELLREAVGYARGRRA